MDMSLWEKLSDVLSAISEVISRLLMRLFGSSNERYIRRLGYVRAKDSTKPYSITPSSLLAQVNEWEERTQSAQRRGAARG